ncbi:tetratricopeptide repeat protein [Caldovatus aquaticus]|uniref:Tetratricopeptide repeat protein n=1 Tax=Caldovatus aquaticus TaxID=2865671 RepID=A0ABS7F5R2_9PROT|nr:tetratricopeptide repeat protein [Caldovatus aquaticus]MBW8270829.1 tetratricopeptide repeat protein [Caldovatus aquaticus]
MPDIFDEVEEDLRAERAARLWKRYGSLVIGAALFVVLGVAAWQGWEWHRQRQLAAAATAYLAAERDAGAPGADLRAAAERFAAIAREAPGGYRVLAALRAAALKAETGEREAALALWDGIARDSGVDPLYRDLATVLLVLHSLDSPAADLARLAERVAPLTDSANPWQASAREVAALLALKRGERETARRMLQALAEDVTAPQGIRGRAGRIAAGLGG